MIAATETDSQEPQGYTSCSCRDCFDIAIGVPGAALCLPCQEAGCEAGAEQECQRADAYGCDDDDQTTSEPN